MKKLIIAISLIMCNYTNSQEIENKSVRKNMLGLHLNLLSFGINDELKIGRKFALHSEVGLMLTPVVETRIDNSKTTFFINFPYYMIEPRYYYGLDRRSRLNKNTENNSSNYIAINTSYLNFTNATNHKDAQKDFNGLLIVPNYGIRRSFSKSFYYESNFGISLAYTILEKNSNYKGDIYELFPYANFALGVNF